MYFNNNYKLTMEATQRSGCQIVTQLVRIGIVAAVTYYCAKWLISSIDPTNKAKKKAKELAQIQLKKLNDMTGKGQGKLKLNDFNCYELMIASHLIAPTDIDVSWSDIAGLDTVIQELRESVVLPVRHSDLFQRSQLWRPPKGVLLYGPPGCGKTLIAKAMAKEACMRFINLDVAVLTDKWYGESQKLATAVFTLAHKLQPCIIFIDEIESFLRMRATGDHEATAMMKTQFMMLWDGLISSTSCSVLVLGATNRPQDLDKAILRRMPAQFHIGPPLECQRLAILQVILQHEQLHSSVDLKRLANLTPGYSGSDLRELCRHASIYRMRQFMRDIMVKEGSVMDEQLLDDSELVISMDDLLKSLVTMNMSKLQTGNTYLAKNIDLD
ncbi:ATPase family AAA domain-containing protein 1 [Drosophila novamexicana]|uniref:ATPase family AAA domain-containing protein 1 n=1 Tax=Drosophila novamexicana TaxID=47314 RepID=UPI0011E5CD00|nr:ATPase family AAA domain-containing protein 1 [Drosophila novamexicana]